MATDTRSTHHDLPGFLRLSLEIRHCIYHLVWSEPWPTEINGHQINRFFQRSMPDLFDLCGPYDPSTKTYNIPPVGYYGLLLSCRTVHAETSALLYSSNQFSCYYETLNSLAPLRDLRPESIAALSSLKIILNQSSCHSRETAGRGEAGCCVGRGVYDVYYQGKNSKHEKDCRYGRHGLKHDLPLRRSHPSTRPMLAEWYKTAAHLGPLITPGQLDLSFVCDVYNRDTELAIMVLDAFRYFLPLKNCHIRLSKTPDPILGDLAKDAVLKSRGIQPRLSLAPIPPPRPAVSRLARLPRELRLRILEYTDLVTPLKEVMWTVFHGKYIASRPACPNWEGRGDHTWQPEVHYGCQFSHCSTRSYPATSIGCYCQLTHAAASSTCRCWATPTPLFLISRSLHHDANLVFFSENRFVVIEGTCLPIFGPPRTSGYDQNHRLAVSQFLRDVVPEGCLGYLRLIEMVFPPYIGGNWPQKGDPVFKDWSKTIDQVKEKLNLPALIIRMVAVYHDDEDDDQHPALTDSEAKIALEGYFHVMRPLVRLAGRDGLAGFYAQLTWPWRRTEAARERAGDWDRQREMDSWMTSRELWLEERAERFVLRDRYDKARLKAKEPRDGAWGPIFVRDY